MSETLEKILYRQDRDQLHDDVAGAYMKALEQRIAGDSLKLPVLPHVIREILSAGDDPNVNARHLSSFIHKDQTLAGHVLRVSNSAVYAGTRKIRSLNQAIARLGGRALVKIAVSITMKGEVFRVSGYEQYIKEIWEHSLVSGSYAQEIAKKCGLSPEELFMCGLMHQVGKPVLLQALVELRREIGTPLSSETIHQFLDFYHPRVGCKLAHAWKLPQSIQAACSFYEDYQRCDEYQGEVYITHLASRLANWAINPEANEIEDLKRASILEKIELKPSDLEELGAQASIILEEVRALSA